MLLVSVLSSPEMHPQTKKRANHNATERARRESLNSRFLELAVALPSLSSARRPSKSLIIQRSLEYVRESLAEAEQRKLEIQKLRKENLTLRNELNRMHLAVGMKNAPVQSNDFKVARNHESIPSCSSSSTNVLHKEYQQSYNDSIIGSSSQPYSEQGMIFPLTSAVHPNYMPLAPTIADNNKQPLSVGSMDQVPISYAIMQTPTANNAGVQVLPTNQQHAGNFAGVVHTPLFSPQLVTQGTRIINNPVQGYSGYQPKQHIFVVQNQNTPITSYFGTPRPNMMYGGRHMTARNAANYRPPIQGIQLCTRYNLPTPDNEDGERMLSKQFTKDPEPEKPQ